MGSFALAAHSLNPYAEVAGSAGVAAPIVADIAALSSAHQAAFQNLLLALDETSRFARFSGTPSDACLSEHAHSALSTGAWIAGAFVDGELRGVVELYDQPDRQMAEVAFVVADGWRRRGLGTALLGAAIAWARESGRQQLRMIFSTRNVPMRRLAQKTQARLDLVLGEMVADVATCGSHVGDPDFENFSSALEVETP